MRGVFWFKEQQRVTRTSYIVHMQGLLQHCLPQTDLWAYSDSSDGPEFKVVSQHLLYSLWATTANLDRFCLLRTEGIRKLQTSLIILD